MKHLWILTLTSLFITGCLNSPTDNEYDNTADLEFLDENAQREDVTVTESGLQYRIIEEGNGDKPGEESVVFVNYTGTLVNGDPAFQSPEGGDILSLNANLIPGIVEGILLMNEGATYELVLPPELAFGDGRVLIIEIELASYLVAPEQFLAENAARDSVEVTESGLQYRVIEQGEGAQPGPDSNVLVAYTGSFTNGYVFDSSEEGNPASFSLAGVIEGFSEGIQLMNEGGIYELYIPPNLGYGDSPPQNSNIPKNVVLVFDVELVSTE